jgi:hypothetical protein
MNCQLKKAFSKPCFNKEIALISEFIPALQNGVENFQHNKPIHHNTNPIIASLKIVFIIQLIIFIIVVNIIHFTN